MQIYSAISEPTQDAHLRRSSENAQGVIRCRRKIMKLSTSWYTTVSSYGTAQKNCTALFINSELQKMMLKKMFKAFKLLLNAFYRWIRDSQLKKNTIRSTSPHNAV